MSRSFELILEIIKFYIRIISQRNFSCYYAAQAKSFGGCTSSLECKIKFRKLCIEELLWVIDEL